MNLLITILNK